MLSILPLKGFFDLTALINDSFKSSAKNNLYFMSYKKKHLFRESSFNMTMGGGGWKYWNSKLEFLAAPRFSFLGTPHPFSVGFEVYRFFPPLDQQFFQSLPFGCL